MADSLEEEKRWGGEFYIVPVSLSQKSQFIAESDNKITADLENSGKTVELFRAFPLVRLDYTLTDWKTQFFFGYGQEQVTKGQIALEFGVTNSPRQDSKVTFAVFPGLPFSGETWQDPFLIGQEREETNERAAGGRIKFEHSGDYTFDVQYAYAKNRMDSEESGVALTQLSDDQRAMLDRNAELHRFTANMTFSVSDSFIVVPGIQVTASESDGAANDFAEGTAVLQSLYFSESHFFSFTLRAGKRESEVSNPVFNRPQNDRSYSVDVLAQHKSVI